MWIRPRLNHSEAPLATHRMTSKRTARTDLSSSNLNASENKMDSPPRLRRSPKNHKTNNPTTPIPSGNSSETRTGLHQKVAGAPNQFQTENSLKAEEVRTSINLKTRSTPKSTHMMHHPDSTNKPSLQLHFLHISPFPRSHPITSTESLNSRWVSAIIFTLNGLLQQKNRDSASKAGWVPGRGTVGNSSSFRV